MVATLLHEIPLQGGDVTDGVVRVGDTVRRPVGPATPAVHALLRHLESAGFGGAPRVVGTDGSGREILTYVPGRSGLVPASSTDAFLADLAVLVREFHDATAGFSLSAGGWEGGSNDDRAPEIIGHCDLTPDNVVFRQDATTTTYLQPTTTPTLIPPPTPAPPPTLIPPPTGTPTAKPPATPTATPAATPCALIDFDLARPTTRLFDIVTTLRHWAPIADPVDRHPLQRNVDVGARIRLFCDAYGLPPRERRRLLELSRLRFHRSYDVMRTRAAAGGNWAKMWTGGAGQRIRRAAAWLDVHEDELHAHLV
ncbi:aminoglycoside phosphotransferase family protein [Nonomuraea spiralis]|uniref:Aminoglycoside phosphotransferase family protein n=1 Tax=Nonomuraea spiralis TaxID=46182 RepID=A0ABV5I9B3_9ACTN|nr:aminoglycoside phosphotransferase family protein [Nonomuraea spiralis]